jgi:hypothetical protein
LRFLLVVPLLALLFGCVTGSDDVVTLDGGDAGTTVDIDKGATLRVSLDGNPTTG